MSWGLHGAWRWVAMLQPVPCNWPCGLSRKRWIASEYQWKINREMKRMFEHRWASLNILWLRIWYEHAQYYTMLLLLRMADDYRQSCGSCLTSTMCLAKVTVQLHAWNATIFVFASFSTILCLQIWHQKVQVHHQMFGIEPPPFESVGHYSAGAPDLHILLSCSAVGSEQLDVCRSSSHLVRKRKYITPEKQDTKQLL